MSDSGSENFDEESIELDVPDEQENALDLPI